MIKIFIVIVILSLPLALIYLNSNHPEVSGKFLFSLFVVGVMIERIWETFFTSKEKEARKYHGDWTLPATVSTFFLTSLFLVLAFYNTATKNIFFVLLGLFIFISAGIIRFWSIKALGEHWSIHLVVNKDQKEKTALTKHGPYKYIRHPIYLGAILELIGITFIVNNFYYFILIVLVNVPLYILRSKYEEKINIKKFGEDYIKYMKEVPLMIPWKIFNYLKNK